jgi:cell wall-associated NlpC family hydrolase
VVALVAVAVVGTVLALIFLPKADSKPVAEEPPSVAVAENVDVDPAPTDEIRYEKAPPEKIEAAREETAALAKARQLERQADIEVEPGEMPPASAGDNGTYDEPPERSRAVNAHTMAGTDGLPPERSAILIGRHAIAPAGAPPEVEQAISAANAIVGTPYIWGGGHADWNDRGYDCSGAVSYALGGAGLLAAPVASGPLMNWGEPGPGKWITVYANPNHTYAVIAGLRWDTVGQQNGSGPKWHAEEPYPGGYVVRHPAGL